jgi:hypothetical protein
VETNDMATDRIRERAFSLWVAAGQPEGRALEHWLQAEREIGGEPVDGPIADTPPEEPEPPLGDADPDVLRTLTEPPPDSRTSVERDG